MEDQNPYAANAQSVTDTSAYEFTAAAPVPAGMVGHVTAVGILQIVLGCLELFVAAMWLVVGLLMPQINKLPTDQPGGPDPKSALMFLIFFSIGAAVLSLFAIMRIGSGIGSFYFRGRLWMIVSLIGGLLSAFTCYCAPFSVALGIYGLVVMFNSQVVTAYKMGKQGVPASEIKRQLLYANYESRAFTPHSDSSH